jgi:hypothetical protein
MPSPKRTLLRLVACIALTSQAVAGDWTIGVEISFDREPDDFSDPKATKYQVSASRKFESGVVVGGSFQPQVKARSGEVGYNLEGTVGYAWKLNSIASLGGSVGAGEKLQQESAGGNFPYYVLRVFLDFALDERWSWNAITYRFRDAFDPADDYNTPEVSTAITLKLDESRSVYTEYYFGWKDSTPDCQGVSIGFKFSF